MSDKLEVKKLAREILRDFGGNRTPFSNAENIVAGWIEDLLKAELTKANAEISRLETCFKVTAVDEATAKGKLKEANERIAELQKYKDELIRAKPHLLKLEQIIKGM